MSNNIELTNDLSDDEALTCLYVDDSAKQSPRGRAFAVRRHNNAAAYCEDEGYDEMCKQLNEMYQELGDKIHKAESNRD